MLTAEQWDLAIAGTMFATVVGGGYAAWEKRRELSPLGWVLLPIALGAMTFALVVLTLLFKNAIG